MRKWLSRCTGTTWSFSDGWRAELHYQYFLWTFRRRGARLKRIEARGPIQLHLEPPRWKAKPWPKVYNKHYIIDRYTNRPTISDPWGYVVIGDAHEKAQYYNEHGTDAFDHDIAVDRIFGGTPSNARIQELVTESLRNARAEGWL